MRGMYDAGVILLSFGIAFVGSYAAITACEQYRLSKIGIIYSRYVQPYMYLIVMAVCLGGVGIWCMHFVGMSAVSLPDENGNNIEIRYDIGITILSLALVIIFSLAGFYAASYDKVFMKTKREIVEMFIEDSSTMSMKDVQKMKTFRMVYLIGTRAPQHLLIGGFITGSGVVLMHYLGMAAMRFPGHIVWHSGVIASSAFIAFFASSAAFWILFRLLSIYPDKENLRLACAFTMAIAVCGMHYTGMMAADFIYDPNQGVSIQSTMSSREAFLAGILTAALVVLFAAVLAFADLRQSVLKMSTELYRADTLLKSIPSHNSVSGNVAKYIAKRKLNKFNLGVLNDTANLMDHEQSDDMSVTSYDDNPGWVQYLWYWFCGGRYPAHMVYGGGASVTSETSDNKVHPDRESSVHYHYGHPRNSARSHHSTHSVHSNIGNLDRHRDKGDKERSVHRRTSNDSSVNTFTAELDSVPSVHVTFKPPLSHASTTYASTDASTSYHSPPGTTTPPPLFANSSVSAADEVDLEAGEGDAMKDSVEVADVAC